MKSAQQWHAMAAELAIETRAFIGGEFTHSVAGETFPCVNPANGKVIAEISACRQADVDRAVMIARECFESGSWRGKAPVARKKILVRFADLILKYAEELALLETMDMGKPIGESLNVDVTGSARSIAWNGEAIDKIYGEVAPSPDNVIGLITREPIGVVAAIVPWNFPLLMACWKLGPALATGNSVILKPSEKSPLTAIRLASIAQEAGIPDGVFQVLPGFGPDAGTPLALHMDIDCIAFTGSTGVAKKLLEYAGQSNMKRVFAECGGKSPNIVFADCPDMEATAESAAAAIFYNQGEVCTAASRLLVEASIKDEFVNKVIAASHAMQPADPLDPDSFMGAIVDEIQLERVLGYIEDGKSNAKLIHGGRRVRQESGGYYIEPTIFDEVDETCKIFHEEIFGPVLSVITFTGMEEAIRLANTSDYGLAAAVWTSDISKAHKTAQALRAGSVWINNWDGGDMTMPFGGYKQSGNGRDKSIHALEKYTELKSTWIEL